MFRFSLTAVAIAAVSMGTFGCASNAEHDDDGMTLGATPTPVQATANKLLAGSKPGEIKKENEDGKTVYEVEYKVGDAEHTASIAEDGQLLEDETEIEAKDLPPAVMEAMTKTQPTGTIKEASKVTAGEKSFYEADVKVKADDSKHEIKVAADGTVLSDKMESKSEDKD